MDKTAFVWALVRFGLGAAGLSLWQASAKVLLRIFEGVEAESGTLNAMATTSGLGLGLLLLLVASWLLFSSGVDDAWLQYKQGRKAKRGSHAQK